MSNKIKIAVLAASLLIVVVMSLGGLGVRASSGDGAYRQLQVYSEVLSRVRSEYVEDPNIPEVTSGALHGLLESLDSNSSYLSPREYKEYKAHTAQDKGTIGAAVSKRFGYAAVVAVLPGGPADKAGVQNTDIFEAIEGRTTREMSLAEIRFLLNGQPGSNVTVSVVRARRAEPQKIVITRDVVNPPAASDKTLEDGVGYIKVDSFTKGKSQEIAGLVRTLQRSAGTKKLVLDLRNCADGDESEGVATANLFLDHGMIAYLQGQKYPRESFNADPQKQITKLPLAVLVNRSTAGPAEVVAAALLDNARADVVGDKTFGDGSVQKVIEMADGSALILSIAKYYSPAGKAIQDTAVTPNVAVTDGDDDAPLPDDDATSTSEEQKKTQPPTDEQLRRALEVLKRKA
jgi:carboxyl-terminal processing protease